jgi:hypothetical protein
MMGGEVEVGYLNPAILDFRTNVTIKISINFGFVLCSVVLGLSCQIIIAIVVPIGVSRTL